MNNKNIENNEEIQEALKNSRVISIDELELQTLIDFKDSLDEK